MKAVAPIFLVLGLSAQSAVAQPATPATFNDHIDTVDVQGQREKDQAAARHFVLSFATKSPIAETFTLWRDKVCPTTLGMKAEYNFFVTQRVRSVATRVGAPVDHNDPCRSNIEIVFTTKPQETLDALRNAAVHAGITLLGYQNVTKAKYPIQAWYGTVTRDGNGRKFIDDPGMGPLIIHNYFGSRLITGVTGEFGTVLILVDSNAVVGRELGAVADYIALIALSQTNAFDTCQEVSTIANLMAPNCPNQTTALTDIDLGYLTGLYKSDHGPEMTQQQRIIAGMKEDIASH